ncbi:MAG: hypothetical protein JXQ97_15420 [Natronospirillum sp.]
MGKPSTIAFIGRKQGTLHRRAKDFLGQWTLEKPRLYEEEGLAESGLIKSNDLKTADIVYTRINPEHVNRRCLRRIRNAEKAANPSAKWINRSDSFEACADKIACFQQWQNQGFKCPQFQHWSAWQPRKNIVTAVLKCLKEYPGVYLRTSNEDSGKGLYFIPQGSSTDYIKGVITKLRFRCLTNRVSGSKIMMVLPINNIDANGLAHVYRVHFSDSELLGGYAIVSRKSIIHASDQSIEDWEEFLQYNQKLHDIAADTDLKTVLWKAMQALGLQTAAVEFFYIDGEIHLLEVNPKWGGKHRFGNAEFTTALKQSPELSNLPMLNAWLNPREYYKKLYKALAK